MRILGYVSHLILIALNESTEFITGHVGGNLEEELHYFAAKNGWEGWAHLVLP